MIWISAERLLLVMGIHWLVIILLLVRVLTEPGRIRYALLPKCTECGKVATWCDYSYKGDSYACREHVEWIGGNPDPITPAEREWWKGEVAKREANNHADA